MDITRHKDGAPVTYRNAGDAEYSAVVVATLRHGDEVNAAELAEKCSFLVETGCTYVTRVRVTDPGGSIWRAGQEVDVATACLRPAQ
jgi:hypothetical protein